MLKQKVLFTFILNSVKRHTLQSSFDVQGCAIKRLCHHQAFETGEHKKIYELRNYQVHPKDVRRYIECSREGMEIRKRYSKLLGYWATEYGGICSQFVHIWEYDSLQDRIEKRGELNKNTGWSKYLDEARSCWQHLESVCLMKLLPWCKLEQNTKEGSVYQLETITMNGDIEKEARLQEYGQACDPGTQRHLVGAWQTVAGPLNSAYLLFSCDTQDAAVQHHMDPNSSAAKAYKSLLPRTSNIHSRIMLPCPWSPMK